MGLDHTSHQPFRLAILARQVVQYHSPLYRQLARSRKVRPTVLFLDRGGAEPAFSPIINQTIQWDIPLLEGFEHYFLRNLSPARHYFLLSRINPGLLTELTPARFDGVLIQGYDILSAWLALALARVRGLKVLFRGESVLKPGGGRGPAGWLKRQAMQTMLVRSDAVLYSCSGNRRAFEHYGCDQRKLFPIPCAVDNGFFRRQHQTLAGQRQQLRQTLGIGPDDFVILYVGRLSHVKRQHDLLRAAALLWRRGLRPTILLVGEGPQRAEIEAIIKTEQLRQVILTGFVNQSQISRYYALADVQTLCSVYDLSPKAICEGLNFSLPVISCDRPGTLGDTIIHQDNALVYPFGNIPALADAIETLMQNRQRCRQMGQRSLAISDLWTLEADVAGIEAAVDWISSPRRPVTPLETSCARPTE